MKRWLTAVIIMALAVPVTGGKDDRLTLNLGKYGKKTIDISKPHYEEDVKWSQSPDGRELWLWIVMPCMCGKTHLMLFIPEKGGGKLKTWSFDQNRHMPSIE